MPAGAPVHPAPSPVHPAASPVHPAAFAQPPFMQPPPPHQQHAHQPQPHQPHPQHGRPLHFPPPQPLYVAPPHYQHPHPAAFAPYPPPYGGHPPAPGYCPPFAGFPGQPGAFVGAPSPVGNLLAVGGGRHASVHQPPPRPQPTDGELLGMVAPWSGKPKRISPSETLYDESFDDVGGAPEVPMEYDEPPPPECSYYAKLKAGMRGAEAVSVERATSTIT